MDPRLSRSKRQRRAGQSVRRRPGQPAPTSFGEVRSVGGGDRGVPTLLCRPPPGLLLPPLPPLPLPAVQTPRNAPGGAAQHNKGLGPEITGLRGHSIDLAALGMAYNSR
ncbi:hypothetical protein NDU88_006027 [Pleurodeles waltl]|uniref:Uncharacterized protein n=1 Tax=Pleurodeles waltl TaxID=8319 RepID=A0AAV7MY40_PLEWA|nr:hypothetical protein NDU88_006027 [Pleurodeles waltl]